MHRHSNSTHARARLLSFLPLAFLISLSFSTSFVNAGANAVDLGARYDLEQRMVVRHAALHARQQDGSSSANGASTSSATKTATSTSTATSTTVAGTGTSSSTSQSTSSTSSQSTSTSSSSVESATSASSSASSSSSSSVTSSASTSMSSSASSSTSSQTALTTTSSSSTAVTSSSAQSTVTSLVIATDVESASSSELSSTSSAKTSSVSVAGSTISASSESSSSSSSFLSNKGAVAAVFTIVGLVAVGAIAAIYIVYKKRKRSEDLDIFDSQYNSNNKDSFFGGSAADRTSLSANAMAYAGTMHADAYEHDYGHAVSDYGLDMPPQMMVQSGDRSSITSNHAGYGAFRAASEPQAQFPAALQPAVVQQPHAPAQRSRLRNVSYGDEGAQDNSYNSPYNAPTVAEHESAHPRRESIYGGMQPSYGNAR